MIVLAITIILLLIIIGATVSILTDSSSTIETTKYAEENLQKQSIIEAINGEIENKRTILMLSGKEITEADIEEMMQNIAEQNNKELTYDETTKEIKSTKGFEISIEEVNK